MPQQIMCAVNNCHYWKQGNMCDANQIFVMSDSLADRLPDTVDALQASTVNATPASTCMETCCKTFVDKNSKAIRADGVIRQ